MKIHCPGCKQQFDVTKDYHGKTVECGTCSHRFKISLDKDVAKKERFYPGEKTDPSLERFGRKTPDVSEVAFEQAQYQPNVNPNLIGPPRPRRTLAVICGLGMMLTITLVFLVAGGKEGAMRDMVTHKRFVLCGFTALVGSILVIYGMVNNRRMAVLIAAVSAFILLCMPVIFPGNPTRGSVLEHSKSSGEPASNAPSDKTADTLQTEKSYLMEIRYAPVAQAINNYPKESVIAVFVRNATPKSRRSISEYLYEATEKKSRETSYDRGESNMMGLILFVEQTMTIEQMAELCKKFGRVEKISKDLRLIDVMVENMKLAKLDDAKIMDANSLDFETQNLKALDSIEPSVRMDAVKRLARSEPRARRDDITQKLIKMLPESKTELQLEIIRALSTWATPESGAGQSVLTAVKKIHKEGKVDRNAMEFLIKFKVEEAGGLLFDLWDKEPAAWSEIVGTLGEGAQVLLLPKLEAMDTAHIVSASAILGKTATKPAIPLIEAVMKKKEGQAKKSLQAAIDEIKRRS